MTKRSYFIVAFIIISLTMGVLIFRPVPIPAEDECLSVSGIVNNVYVTGDEDIVISLMNNDKVYYINRGITYGLDLHELQTAIMNKEVILKYPDYWTPLDPKNSVRHLSKIECEGQTVYTEVN